MNPKLLIALRKARRAGQRAEAAGTPLSPEAVEAFLREETGGAYGLSDAQALLEQQDSSIGSRNLLRSFVQGLTFNFGDELLGALPEALGGGEGAKEEMRLREELFTEQHPIAAGVANLAGGLVLPGTAAARGGMNFARGVPRAMQFGAVQGGLGGAGATEGGLTERAEGAVLPAAGGAAAGVALPMVGGAVAAAFAPAQRAARRIEAAIAEDGGRPALSNRLADLEATGRGGHARLADLGPRLHQEADYIANNSDEGLVQIAEEVQNRFRNSPSRLLSGARDAYGARPSATLTKERLEEEARAWADSPAGYAGLRARNPQIWDFPALGAATETLRQAPVRRAIEKAQADGLVGNIPDSGSPSFAHIHDAIQALDSQASREFKSGSGTLGARLVEAKDRLKGLLREVVPEYRDVDDAYRARKSVIRALDEGVKDFDSEDITAIADRVANFTPAELEGYRVGLASKFMDRLANARKNRDTARQVLESSDAMQAKLQVAFGSPEAFNEFMADATQEGVLTRLRGAVSGSQTHRRAMAAGFDPAELGLQAVPAAAAGNVGGVLSQLTQGLTNRTLGTMRRNTAASELPMIMSGGVGLRDLLRGPVRPEVTVPNWVTNRGPRAVGNLLGQPRPEERRY